MQTTRTEIKQVEVQVTEYACDVCHATLDEGDVYAVSAYVRPAGSKKRHEFVAEMCRPCAANMLHGMRQMGGEPFMKHEEPLMNSSSEVQKWLKENNEISAADVVGAQQTE